MSNAATDTESLATATPSPPAATGWRELWQKEDWWAIWLGLGIVLAAYLLFASGSSLKWLAVTPAKWSSFAQLARTLPTMPFAPSRNLFFG